MNNPFSDLQRFALLAIVMRIGLLDLLPLGYYEFMRKFHVIYEYIVFLIALFLNMLIVYFLRNRSKKSSAQFRRILMLGCGIDLVFAVTNVCTMELAELIDDKVYLILDGPLPRSSAALSTIVWIFVMNMTLVTIMMQFVCRYGYVCCRVPFSTSQFYTLYALCGCYIAGHSTALYFSYQHEGAEGWEVNITYYENILAETKLFRVDTPSFIVGDLNNTITLVQSLEGAVLIAAIYVVVVYCGMRVYQSLQAKRDVMTKEVYQLQGQLTKIMVLQALYPFAMVASPIFLSNIFPIVGIDIPYIGFHFTMMASSIPTLNALSVILIVPSYRTAFVELLKKRRLPTISFGGLSSNGHGSTATRPAQSEPTRRSNGNGVHTSVDS